MRSNLQIKVGTYTGDGADNRNITGIGFRPDLVIVNRDASNTVFRTKERRGDSTGFLASSNTDLTNQIQEFLNDGFQIGTASQVNANTVVYYYIAIKGNAGQSHFRTGNYVGDGADSRDFITGGLNFTPDLVFLQAISGAVQAMFKTSSMAGDTSIRFEDTAGIANAIQNLQSNGFQVGTDARVNASTVEYFFVALKKLAGAIAVGTFIGTGVAKSITGLGFKPDFVIVKNYNTTNQARMLTADMVTAAVNSIFMGSIASDANGITTLDLDGFSVGTGADVNGNTNTLYWIAFKSGNFNAPVARTAV